MCIIYKQHYVRQFQRGSFSDFHAWRQPFNNCCLRCPYKCLAERFPFVAVQVNGCQQATAFASVGCCPFNIDKFLFWFCKNSVFQIFIHSAADFFNSLCFVLFAKINFRQNKIQGRRLSSADFFDIFPIFFVLSILVAGNYCPFFRINFFRK